MKLPWMIGLLLLKTQQEYETVDQDLPSFSKKIEKQQSEVITDLTIFYEKEPVMTINRSDISLPLLDFPIIDSMKLQNIMDELNKTIQTDATNASLDEYGRIIPEKPGIQLNKQAFKEQVYSAF